MFWQILKQLFPSVSVPSEKYSPPLQGIIVKYTLLCIWKLIAPSVDEKLEWEAKIRGI